MFLSFTAWIFAWSFGEKIFREGSVFRNFWEIQPGVSGNCSLAVFLHRGIWKLFPCGGFFTEGSGKCSVVHKVIVTVFCIIIFLVHDSRLRLPIDYFYCILRYIFVLVVNFKYTKNKNKVNEFVIPAVIFNSFDVTWNNLLP